MKKLRRVHIFGISLTYSHIKQARIKQGKTSHNSVSSLTFHHLLNQILGQGLWLMLCSSCAGFSPALHVFRAEIRVVKTKCPKRLGIPAPFFEHLARGFIEVFAGCAMETGV